MGYLQYRFYIRSKFSESEIPETALMDYVSCPEFRRIVESRVNKCTINTLIPLPYLQMFTFIQKMDTQLMLVCRLILKLCHLDWVQLWNSNKGENVAGLSVDRSRKSLRYVWRYVGKKMAGKGKLNNLSQPYFAHDRFQIISVKETAQTFKEKFMSTNPISITTIPPPDARYRYIGHTVSSDFTPKCKGMAKDDWWHAVQDVTRLITSRHWWAFILRTSALILFHSLTICGFLCGFIDFVFFNLQKHAADWRIIFIKRVYTP